MKWAAWIIALPLLYVLSIGPVAYFEIKAKHRPYRTISIVRDKRLVGCIFFRGGWGPPQFESLPQWLQTFYAPLRNQAISDKAPGLLVNDYTGWWVSLAY